MVDFRQLMSQQTRAEHDHYIRTRDDVMALDPSAFIGMVIHNLHNCAQSLHRKGEPVYGATRDHILVPEMLRRLCGGSIPRLCPVCGADPDWDRALVTVTEGGGRTS